MDDNRTPPSQRTSRRPQFTLGRLLEVVTGTALLFSLWSLFGRLDGAVVGTGLLALDWLVLRALLDSRRSQVDYPPDGGRPDGRHSITTPWTIFLLSSATGAGGAWLFGFHVLAILGWQCPRYSILGVLVPLAWTLGGAALGAGALGLAWLLAGTGLSRRFACAFALAIGWLAGAVSTVAWRFAESDAPGWISVSLAGAGLVAGILLAALLRAFGRHARRWAAWAAAPILAVGTLLTLYRFITQYAVFGTLVVRDFILLMAAVCLAAVVAGMIGALLGALRDRRRGVAFLAPLATCESTAADREPDGSWPAASSAVDIYSAKRQMDRRRLRRTNVLLAGLAALLAAILAYPHRHTITSFFHQQRRALTEFFDARYEAHRQRLLEDAMRRQTVDLPTVDRAEVFSLEEPSYWQPGADGDNAVGPKSGFPVGPYRHLVQIHRSGTLAGQEAEELARLWRSRTFDDSGGALDHHHVYGLHFYSKGRLVLETSLCWENSNCSVEDGGIDHAWIGFWDEDEKLLARLQEIAPMPNSRKAWFLVRRSWLASGEGDLNAALGYANEAIALQPDYALAYCSRGATYRRLGKLDEALADYTKAIELQEPVHVPVDAYRERGLALLQLGEYQEALADFNRIINEEHGWNPDTYRQRAKVYQAMGRKDLAGADQQTARRLDADIRVGLGPLGLGQDEQTSSPTTP